MSRINLSWRFLVAALAVSLTVIWAIGRPWLHDPRGLLSSAAATLQNVATSVTDVTDAVGALASAGHDADEVDDTEESDASTSALGNTTDSRPPPALGRWHPGNRPLVLFAYAESATARIDLAFFVRNGLHAHADFVFVFNGPTNATSMVPRNLPNVWTVQRTNSCFDMGAFGEVLRTDDLWKRYRRFITMNASLRGPFLPVYSSACWTDMFLNRVTDTTKLVGLTMNCYPRPHVQSMLWATDDVGMGILLDPKLAHSVPRDDGFGDHTDPVGFSACYPDWSKAVHAEIGTTELITSQGYAVDVMLTSFHGQVSTQPPMDVTGPLEYCKATGNPKDHLLHDGYFGSNVHPYETIFHKANRDIDAPLLEHMTEWHMTMARTSWDMCKE